jgi:hypothetical protein
LKWQAPDRLKAIRLLGRQPMDLLADERVLMIYLACDAMQPEGPSSLDDMRTETNDLELERIKERVQGRGADRKKPASPEAGKSALLALIERTTGRLEARLTVHRQRREFEKAVQMDLLAFDDSPQGELLRRYRLARDREFHRALNALFKVRREILAAAEGDLPDAGCMDTADAWAALEASLAAEPIPVAAPESAGWVQPVDTTPSDPACYAEPNSSPPLPQEPLADHAVPDKTNPIPAADGDDKTNPNPPESTPKTAAEPSIAATGGAMEWREPSQMPSPMTVQALGEPTRRPASKEAAESQPVSRP